MDSIEETLANIPEESILFKISPPAAREFGVLPVGFSDEVLKVVKLKGRPRLSEDLAYELFGVKIEYLGEAEEKIWTAAYERFYVNFINS